MYEDNLYMSNLFSYLSFEDTTKPAPAEPVALASRQVNGTTPESRGIEFRGVGFRYPGREDWALRNIDVVIPEGESLALVGQNGAGKTTFIKLLTRLYQPTEGHMCSTARSRGLGRGPLRHRISVVFQDFAQYQLSAGENVGLGRSSNSKTLRRSNAQ